MSERHAVQSPFAKSNSNLGMDIEQGLLHFSEESVWNRGRLTVTRRDYGAFERRRFCIINNPQLEPGEYLRLPRP